LAGPSASLVLAQASFKALTLSETAIPNKFKELIGLAVSGATRCRYCAYYHTEAARLFGATEEEIVEASLMAKNTMGWSTYLNALQTDYDPFTAEFLGFALDHGVYLPIPPDPQGRRLSRRLGLLLVPWDGSYGGEAAAAAAGRIRCADGGAATDESVRADGELLCDHEWGDVADGAGAVRCDLPVRLVGGWDGDTAGDRAAVQ